MAGVAVPARADAAGGRPWDADAGLWPAESRWRAAVLVLAQPREAVVACPSAAVVWKGCLLVC